MPKPIRPFPGKVPTGQISWLLGRVHVGESGLSVARDIWRRSATWPRSARRAAVRYAIRQHEQNRALYRAIVTGRL